MVVLYRLVVRDRNNKVIVAKDFENRQYAYNYMMRLKLEQDHEARMYEPSDDFIRRGVDRKCFPEIHCKAKRRGNGEIEYIQNSSSVFDRSYYQDDKNPARNYIERIDVPVKYPLGFVLEEKRLVHWRDEDIEKMRKYPNSQ